MQYVNIQGIDCSFREQKEDEIILFSEFEQAEQYFKRTTHPFTDPELEALVEKTHQYTSEQAKWKELEEWRFEHGVYALINGKLKFIPGSYYCYVNYWHLEDGEHPDYREDEREFALFLEYCCFRSPLYGVTRPKGRRQGATSFGAFFEWFIGGRKEHQNVGTVSFNDDAAADVFVNMIMPGFKGLLPCFQAEFDSPDDGKTFLRFVKPTGKKSKGIGAVKRQGLNSLIDFKALALNSYTNKRLSFLLLDEFGRWAKLNCNLYWSKVSKALRKGKKKVGFAYLPTVVNPRDQGGENYKRFYEKSDQRKYGINTPTGVVIYIMYGTQCYAGCIDKFGESVIEDPIEPIMGNDGDWITEGSRGLILKERALLTDDELMENRRDFPIDEYDIFAFETGNCEFNEKRLIDQITNLSINPSFLRRVRLSENKKIIKAVLPGKLDRTQLTVQWMDDESAKWLLLEEPEEKNKFTVHNGIYTPQNTLNYCIGVDMFKIGFSEHGSKGTICVFKKSCVINGVETGNYPVAMYLGRPKLVQHLYDEVIKACLFYGCKVNFEIDAGDFFYGYFFERDMSDFLYWTPARNVNKPNQMLKPGTESANPYEIAQQLECAKVYLDGNNPYEYNGNIERVKFPSLLQQALSYNHSERTPYDEMIGFMMALLPALKIPDNRIPTNAKPLQLLPTYKIKQPA